MKIGNDGGRVGVKTGNVGGRGERFSKNGKWWKGVSRGSKMEFSKMSGNIFPALGYQKYAFLAYSRTLEVQFGKPVRRFNSNRLSRRGCMITPYNGHESDHGTHLIQK